MANKTVYEILKENLTTEELSIVDKTLRMSILGKCVDPDMNWECINIILKTNNFSVKQSLGNVYKKLYALYVMHNEDVKITSKKLIAEAHDILREANLYIHGKCRYGLSKETYKLGELLDAIDILTKQLRAMDSIKKNANKDV